MRGQRETRPCAACGKQLNRLISQARGKLWFCDNACQAIHMPPPGTISKAPNPYRGQRLTKACDQCGKPVTRYLTPDRLEKAWFCSYACRGRWQQQTRIENGKFVRGVKPRTGDTVECLVCGTPFYRQPAYIRQGRKLCSRGCNKVWQSRRQLTKLCPQCDESFKVAPSETNTVHCSRHCEVKARTLGDTGRMHNGRPVIKNAQGYLTVYEPTHPAASKSGRVLEHRLVVERILGRYLTSAETVNHKNHVRDDNDPSNLEVLSNSDHGKETNAYTLAARDAMKAKLAAYEAKYGPLME